MNDDIKKYTTPSGKNRFKFAIYAGKDNSNGESKTIRKRGFKTYEQAEKAYKLIRKQVENGEYSPNRDKRLRYKQVYEQWIKIYAETVKESTLATTVRIMKQHVLPKLGNMYIDSISVMKCQKVVNEWSKKAPRTFKKYIRYANNVFMFAEHLELINSSPMDKVIRPRVKKSHEPFNQFYTKDELKRYLFFAKEYKFKAYVFFQLLSYSGLRCGEALALKWSDVDFINNAVIVRRTVSKGLNNRILIQSPKTYSSARTVTLPQETMDILRKWELEQKSTPTIIHLNSDSFVFEGMRDGYPTNYPMSATTASTWNNIISKKAGLKHIKLHGFRHTHASLLFEAKVPMEDIKERLGHKSIKTTMDVYTHLTKKQNRETADSFEHFMRA